MLTNFICTYLIGPLASLLPQRWRSALPIAACVEWERATTLSGILEMVAAIVGLAYWYMHMMGRIAGRGMDMAVNGNFGPAVTEHQIGGAAFFLFLLEPLTWILVYVFFEGAARFMAAAFTENVHGTLPLYLLDGLIVLVRNEGEEKPRERARKNLESFLISLRDWRLMKRQKQLPDEIRYTKNATEEFLEIWASRKKDDWVAPQIVRVDDAFYRLEGSGVEKGDRPFRYRLKRLEAGVNSRTVVRYDTANVFVKEQ